MFPDFPALRTEIERIITAKLRHSVDIGYLVLAQIKRIRQVEGSEMRYEQLGAGKVQEGFEQIGTNFEVSIDEVPTLIGDKLDIKINEMAQELISQSAKAFFKKVGESCDKIGNSIDVGGKPLSADMMLEMISTTQMEFDADGNPTNSFVIHPEMAPSIKRLQEQFDNDPELQQRHAEILERQRDAWITRESNRKLVD